MFSIIAVEPCLLLVYGVFGLDINCSQHFLSINSIDITRISSSNFRVVIIMILFLKVYFHNPLNTCFGLSPVNIIVYCGGLV